MIEATQSCAHTISRRHIMAGIIGNILTHYDTALFGLLAPILAPLFFPTFEPLNALILTYCLIPVGILSRPIGSLIFGRIGDRIGRKEALFISIIGTAAVTGLMGCLPTYEKAGIGAPILLAISRVLQNLFASGEYIGGAIFVLEHYEKDKKSFLGSLYSCSTIIGILAASLLIAILANLGLVETHWRWLFFLGFLTGGLGIFLRFGVTESPLFLKSKAVIQPGSIMKVLKNHKREFIAIIAVSGLSYAIYETIFVFMNGYLPRVSQVESSQIMNLNTLLLCLDLILLPFFGWISDKMSPVRNMSISGILILLSIMPLFALCDGASYAQVIFIRTTLIILGVWFCAPFHAWTQQLIPIQNRYTVVSLGYALGSQLIGAPTASIGLWLYRTTNTVASPALYLMIVAFVAMGILALVNAKVRRLPKALECESEAFAF